MATSFPKLFITLIKMAGAIPTSGPTIGIKLDNPEIMEIKIKQID